MSHNETTIEWGDYIFAAEGLSNLIGKLGENDHHVFGFVINGQVYTLKTRLFEDNSDDMQLWIALHSVNDKKGRTTNVYNCYLYNGHSSELLGSTNNNIGEIDPFQQISVFCPVKDNKTLYIWYTVIVEDQFYKELFTGTPAQSGTVIGTPLSSGAPTQTPIPTFTPIVSETRPTATLTPTIGAPR